MTEKKKEKRERFTQNCWRANADHLIRQGGWEEGKRTSRPKASRGQRYPCPTISCDAKGKI